MSLHAMKGSTNYKTLKVCAKVKDKDILILIDCGSTHCFLNEKIAKVLDCKLENTMPMTIKVADGSQLISSLMCSGFKREMQDLFLLILLDYSN